MDIEEEQQCPDLFLLLYEMFLKAEQGHADGHAEPPDVPCELRLTQGLGLYMGKQLIFQFSGEELQRELGQREFII